MEQSAPSKTVFIVEDNEVIREGITSILERQGYTVVSAKHGQEALGLLISGQQANLILLDMMLPVQDGWSFLRERQRYDRIAAIPVIIMTSLGVASPEWARALGALGLIRKPVETDVLLKEVGRYV